eukprot:CAMPEP_0203633638 /NCGR_PEP_ID=MMETSP0088-20131115/723_1 /ASSEMBLY_ACC=CAM_ASM_001087 /TAXON_ID=426623 /ORGANISM="Chaetoceros affinis, Strain CCMP159" /LENGTH=496 /DNA_ID=CAMNT_0050487015 /DNA_START=21 /DNA_END=1511 /DNA_ORIENTATION=+
MGQVAKVHLRRSNNSRGNKRPSPLLLTFISALQVLLLSSTSTLTLTSALYTTNDPSSHVQTFESSADFRKRVIESDSIWLVQFYAPWCGHCKQFQPTYTKLASLFRGIVNVGAVDASKSDGFEQRVASEYGVTGFPTMKLFAGDGSGSGSGKKRVPADVNSRDPNEILNMVMESIKTTVQERASGGSGGSSSGGSGSSSGSSGGSSSKKKSASKVLQLTSSNFAEQVYNNDEVVLVAFAAPWCGHCKQLLPEWEEAASKLDNSGASLAWVDATAEESLAQQFRIQGFPTIKVFPGGKTDASYASDYNGGRQAAQIVEAALAEVDRSGVPKEIPELTGPDLMAENCEGGGKATICVFFALPHILDSGAEGRNKYRDIMTSASKAVRGMSFQFMWFEGGAQPDLETTLELTFGFPAVAAYSVDKGVYTVHRSSFTEKNLRQFLTGITTGKQGTYKVSSVPEIKTVEPWDGKDGVPFEEEVWWDDDDFGDDTDSTGDEF